MNPEKAHCLRQLCDVGQRIPYQHARKKQATNHSPFLSLFNFSVSFAWKRNSCCCRCRRYYCNYIFWLLHRHTSFLSFSPITEKDSCSLSVFPSCSLCADKTLNATQKRGRVRESVEKVPKTQQQWFSLLVVLLLRLFFYFCTLASQLSLTQLFLVNDQRGWESKRSDERGKGGTLCTRFLFPGFLFAFAFPFT